MAILLEANSPLVRRHDLIERYAQKAQQLNQEGKCDETQGPLGPTLWIAGSGMAANAIREQLVEHSAEPDSPPAPILQPGVRTLRQAAETLASMSEESWHPLSKVQQRWLIGKIAEEGKHKGSLGPLEELAASRGLVDLLTNRFDQIRELGLSIEAAGAHLRRSEGRVGNAMSHLYASYCDALDGWRLFDKAAKFDLACREVAAWKSRLELLVIETLVPTSPIEKRFLAELLQHSEESIISVVGRPQHLNEQTTLGQANTWKNLFDLPMSGSPMRLEAKANQPPALSSLSDRLFTEKTEPEIQVADEGAIEIVATTSTQEELRQVARRIKKLLVNKDSKPNEIVVTANHLSRHAEQIESTFAEYGIPVARESYPRLKESAWINVVKQLLEVANTDWQQEPLLSLLGRRELKAIRLDERHDAEKLIRELGLPSGSRYLIQQTESLASRAKTAYPPRNAAIAKQGLGALITISDAVDHLPEKATPLAWFDSIGHAVQQLGYSSTPESLVNLSGSKGSQFVVKRDRLAREALEAAFLDLELLAEWRNANPPQLALRDLVKLLTDWSERLTLPAPSSSEPRVQVVTTDTAIGLTPKHLFLVRLEESSFASSSPRESLATDSRAMAIDLGEEADLREVTTSANALEGKDSGRFESERITTSVERLLFQQLVSLPTKSLTFSYAALDEKAVTLHPSPYLTEVERLFPTGSLRQSSYRLGVIDLESIPYSLREQRLHAVGNLVDGKSEPLVKLFEQQELAQKASLRGSLEVVSERWRGDTYGLAEGICTSEQVVESLSNKFGPKHLWSASQLETYANCPFKFFAKYLLDANPLGDSQFEVDYRRRGTLLHDAMVELHSTLSKKLGRGDRLSDFDPKELSSLFREAVESVASSRGLPSHEIGLGEIEQEQTLAWADLYPKQLASFDDKWSTLDDPLKPEYYEARFGPMHRDPDEEVEDEVSTDEPYPFKLPNGEVLLLTGKIDRIDVGEIAGQAVFGIVDYKTGSNNETKQEEIVSGKKIQLALYALAAEELFFDADNAVPIAAGYWDIKKKGFLGAGKLELAKLDEKGATLTSDWAETIEAVRGRVETIVESVRHGEFPMYNTDSECSRYCDYHTICRVKQARNRDKIWPPPPEKPDAASSSGSNRGVK